MRVLAYCLFCISWWRERVCSSYYNPNISFILQPISTVFYCFNKKITKNKIVITIDSMYTKLSYLGDLICISAYKISQKLVKLIRYDIINCCSLHWYKVYCPKSFSELMCCLLKYVPLLCKRNMQESSYKRWTTLPVNNVNKVWFKVFHLFLHRLRLFILAFGIGIGVAFLGHAIYDLVQRGNNEDRWTKIPANRMAPKVT